MHRGLLLLAMLTVTLAGCSLDFDEFPAEAGAGASGTHGGNGGSPSKTSGSGASGSGASGEGASSGRGGGSGGGATGGGGTGDAGEAGKGDAGSSGNSGGTGGGGGSGADDKPDAGPDAPTCKTAKCDLEDATCDDSSGTAVCTCAGGYTDVNGDGSDCQDIDECAAGGSANCNPNADCTNTPGTFTCKCKSGWNGDGVDSCEQNVECADAAGSNCATQAACNTVSGTMYCVCNDGYEGDGATCTPVDECTRDLDDCHPLATCSDKTPGFDCDCPDGYTGDGHGADGCIDIDECDDNHGGCDSVATCSNTGGSHSCACPSTHWGTATGAQGCMVKAVAVGAGGGVAALNYGVSCAALATGKVKCWGQNFLGQLGQDDKLPRGDGAGEMGDDLDPIALGTGKAVAVSVGEANVCALFSNGTARCWGSNASGLLGLGMNNTDLPALGDDAGEMEAAANLQLSGTIAEIKALYGHTCARITTGAVKCWGGNDKGQLGRSNADNYGDDPFEVLSTLSAIPLVGNSSSLTAISIPDGPSAAHSCAVLSDNSLKCWGTNNYGQLGLGDTTPRGNTSGQMGDSLPFVSLGAFGVQAVSIGQTLSCALLDFGLVKCWGTAGVLGLENTVKHGSGTNEMGDNLPAVSLGTQRSAVSIASGIAHTCAVLDNGTVKCWGGNTQGVLGLGISSSSELRGDAASEMGDNLPAVALGSGLKAVSIAAGARHNCVLFDNGGVKCWGNNTSGELGQGDTTVRGTSASDMGDNLKFVDLGH